MLKNSRKSQLLILAVFVVSSLSCEKDRQPVVFSPELEDDYSHARDRWRDGKYIEALAEIRELIQIGKNTNNPNVIGRAYFLKGYVHESLEEQDSALGAFLKSRKAYKEAGDVVKFSNTCSKISSFLIDNNKISGAEKFVRESMSSALESSDKKMLANAYLNFGVWFTKRGQFDSALVYYGKSRIEEKALGRNYKLSNLYMGEGHVLAQIGEYKLAEEKYMEALTIASEFKYSDLLVGTNSSIGYVKFKQGFVEESIEFYRNALDHSREVDEHRSPTYNNLGEVFLELGEFEKAVNSFRQSLKCQKTDGYEIEEEIMSSYRGLAKYHEFLGNQDSSSYYIERQKAVMSTIALRKTTVEFERLRKNIDIILQLDRAGDL